MRTTWRIRLGMALATLAASAGASGQAAIVSPSSPMVMISSKGPNAETVQAGGEVVREIDDPNTGARWLLTRDSNRLGGPGRMVLAAEPRGQALNIAANATGTGAGQFHTGSAQAQAAIRAGDRLIVEQDTAVVEARLEAVALNSAAVGSQFNARLALGGKVVHVMALAPGRAALLAETEARP